MSLSRLLRVKARQTGICKESKPTDTQTATHWASRWPLRFGTFGARRWRGRPLEMATRALRCPDVADFGAPAGKGPHARFRGPVPKCWTCFLVNAMLAATIGR